MDPFSGYVIAKTSGSRSAQTIAESYEDCVFRRFGASEVIRNDREPGFLSYFLRTFQQDRRTETTSFDVVQAARQWNGRTNGADLDEGVENVCYGR